MSDVDEKMVNSANMFMSHLPIALQRIREFPLFFLFAGFRLATAQRVEEDVERYVNVSW